MTISTTTRMKRRREKLWMKDPRCYICQRMTVLPKDAARFLDVDAAQLFRKGILTPELRNPIATLDHLVSRYNKEQRHSKEHSSREQTKLCCWECNDKRSKEETAQIRIATLQQLASMHPNHYNPGYQSA